MKKLLISASLLLSASVPAFAEGTIYDNPNNHAYFGVRVGGDIVIPGDFKSGGIGVDLFNTGGGIEFGGIYNVPLYKNLYLEPGLKLYYDTFSSKYSVLDEYDDESAKVTMGAFGMRIPVMVGYRFDFTDDLSLSVFTGPELEIGFTGKQKAKFDDYTVSEDLYGEDGIKRTDLLWDFGVGFNINKFYVGLSGNIGMLNLLDDDYGDVSFRKNRVTVSVGYNF